MLRVLAVTAGLIAIVMLGGCGRGGHWPFWRRHRVEAPQAAPPAPRPIDRVYFTGQP
jgi:hypothetical protein